MADQFTYAKLPSDPCLTQEQITAYLDGKLSAAEQHACEQHMADCAMCEDAVEGLALVKDRSVLALPLIKESSVPAESKVIPLHQPDRRKMWYAIAAVLVLVLGSTFLIRMMDNNGPDGFAQNESKDVQYDSMSAPADKFSLLENDQKMDSANYEVTTSDANGNAVLRSEQPTTQNAPRAMNNADAEYAPEENNKVPDPNSITEEGTVVTGEVTRDEDAEVATIDALKTNEKTELAKEETKKPNFWNRSTFDLPSGNPKPDNSKTVEQTTLVNENAAGNSGGSNNAGDDSKDKKANAEAEKPQVVAGVPASPQSNVATQSPSLVYDRYTDSGVVYNQVVADTTHVDQLEVSYINGINLLAAGQANAAITMFDKVMLDKNHPRYEDAEFQKAKALIKANRKDEAKVLLQAIELKKGKHAAEATELLKTL
jgi:hypothetical protein